MDLYTLATSQHAAVSVPQLRSIGLSLHAIEHLIASGQWLRVTPMVIRRTGSPRTDGQAAVEAVLDAGCRAALSHGSDAAWWGLPGFRLRPLNVTRLRDATSTPSRLSIIHEPRALPDHHLAVHRGVTVIVPSRIPFDIAARDPRGAERALDRGWARHLLNHQSEMRMLHDLAERGRRGITLMRDLLDARGPDYRPNDTGTEDRMQELCRLVGLDVERQRDLLGQGEWLGRYDFVDEERKLVLEVDSALYHEALIDERADEARTAALTAVGYDVHRFTDHEIFYDRAGSLVRLRAIRSGA